MTPSFIYQNLTADTRRNPRDLPFTPGAEQLSLFPPPSIPALTGGMGQGPAPGGATALPKGGALPWSIPAM